MTSRQVETLLSTVADGRMTDLRYKQRQFISLHGWIIGHLTQIYNALVQDEGFSGPEAHFLVMTTLEQLRSLYDALNLKTEISAEYRIKNSQSNANRRVPDGLVYLVPESYTAFYSILSAVGACIAAGSCCLIEIAIPFQPRGYSLDGDSTGQISSRLSSVSRITLQCLTEALDPQAFIVTDTRPTADVLSKWLVLDQRGTVPRNLGRRCLDSDPSSCAVAIVDRTTNLKAAADEILASRRIFSGRGPYAPNCILVNEFVEEEFLGLLHHAASSNGSTEATDGVLEHKPLQKSTTRHSNAWPADADCTEYPFELSKISTRAELQSNLTKLPGSLTLLTVSSHDDAIDALNQATNRPLLALYVFADDNAAKYLTQFVHARSSFVNYIPPTLLVGPAAPINYTVSPRMRYSRAMLETPSAQFYHHKARRTELQAITSTDSTVSHKTYVASVKPLKNPDQPKPGEMNFFAQAMLATGIFIVLPAMAAVLPASLYLGYRLYRYLL